MTIPFRKRTLAVAACALAVSTCLALPLSAQPRSLTPKPSPAPRINGPTIYGCRPGAPFAYTIPATGERPMEFSAAGLPSGLMLDPKTGRIKGSMAIKGTYAVKVRAKNALGAAERTFRIVVGDKIALTPPMGWSSWYMAYTNISDKMVRAQAEAMVSSGLIDHGYAYVNIDDGWNVKLDSNDTVLGGPPRDAAGNLRPNKNFPDMKALCDAVHALGLKAGIYISPGPATCAGFAGSYEHAEQDAKQFADWGFDFLKYDWCSYDKVAVDRTVPSLQLPYISMRSALDKVRRDIVYNLCQYGMGNVWEWGREVGGDYWRTTGDLGSPPEDKSLWTSMSRIGFGQAGKEKFAGPGGWNDPDNILVGAILWGDKLVPTPLSPDEQYTYMSLWALLAAPLIFGGDMTQLDDFTLGLLANDEVIEVNQDALGKQAAPVARLADCEAWAKDMEDGSKAVGFFNRGQSATTVTARWEDLGIKGKWKVRDLWRQYDWGVFENWFTQKVNRHGAVLLRLSPVVEPKHK
ncbi:MAG TPA: putative Ig domain-containing protein [Terriglobales bacterium]|nr:putative Ig domain-containing protein [Terriglobales bacterium]